MGTRGGAFGSLIWRPPFAARKRDRVAFKGGYKRLDENHAVLDPCMANAIVAVASAPMAAIER